jgi:hypothetical protein
MISLLSKAVLSAGVGYGAYKYNQKKLDLDQYFVSGYNFKFYIGDNFEFNKEELKAYSDKFKYYGDFIKEHSPKDRNIPVIMFKQRKEGFCTVEGQAIAIPGEALVPASIFPKLTEAQQKYATSCQEHAEASLMHELGHIVHDHTYQRKKMGATMLSMQVFSSFGGWKCVIPTFFVTTSYLLWLNRHQEYEADAYAVKQGYGPDLIADFEQIAELSKKYSNSIFITNSGNYLLDIHHPLLTDRIARMRQLMDQSE